MTAEVAVMNRSAVALAADSAVTLSGLDPSSGVDKVFQNENKLFELSRIFPLGLMIYNATSFFDIPWEVIIKDFRKEEGGTPSGQLFDWADRFRDYLMNHQTFRPSVERQREFVKIILSDELSRVFQGWIDDARPLLFQRQTKRTLRQYPVIFMHHVNERIEHYESAPYFHGFDEDLADRVIGLYKHEYEKTKMECFGEFPFREEDEKLLLRLAKAVLSRARRRWFTTGLVFAGYGSKELFPSLVSLEVGGVVGGKLRWAETRRIDIDRASTTAEIIPFAQRETVDALLFGRADSYERQVVRHFTKAARQLGKGVVEQLTGPGAKRRDFEDRVDAAVSGILNNFHEHHAEQLRTAFARDTLDSVRHMPKPDLAAFAESLVTVTSMMRKASIGPETVGGPVDVAVISRHEGFIWVKRKHYFDPDLNRRYMRRAFGSNEGGNSDVGTG